LECSREVVDPASKRRREEGIYLIVVALAAGAIIALIALTIGLGFVATGTTRLQAVGDLTATAALEAYLRPVAAGEDGDLEQLRRQAGRERAEEILKQNRVPGISQEFGSLSVYSSDYSGPEPGESGFVQYGIYYETPPAVIPDPDPCEGTYPCFQVAGPEDLANAVRTVVGTQPDNPLFSRAARWFSSGEFILQVESTARIRETCTVYLLDASLTTTRDEYPFAPNEFHNSSAGQVARVIAPQAIYGIGLDSGSIPPPVIPPPVPKVPDADDPDEYTYRGAMFAYRAACVVNSSGTPRDCNNPSNFALCLNHNPVGSPPYNPDLVHWCSMREARKGADPPPLPGEHFRSDYVRRITFDGDPGREMLVARYRDDSPELLLPRPLDFFMRGFNAGLRLADNNANADRALLMAFTGKVHNRYIPHPTQFEGQGNRIHFTRDLGYLIQITNMENIGEVTGEMHSVYPWGKIESNTEKIPNLFDKGFFPSLIGFDATNPEQTALHSATNISEAIWEGASALVQYCPERARKQIVLATDGRASCRFIPPESWSDSADDGVTDCDPQHEWAHYVYTERQLLQDILPKLQTENIALTTILSGDGVRLEYRNIKNPQAPAGCQNTNDPHCFLNFETAADYGYGGYNSSDPYIPPNAKNLPPCAGNNHKSLFPCRSYLATGYNKQQGFDYTFATGAQNTEYAYRQVRYIREYPESGVRKGAQFGRPINLFGHLAMRTGGIICPLLETGAQHSYFNPDPESDGQCKGYAAPGETPCLLKNSFRNVHGVSSTALEYLPKVEQAARCIEKAIGKDLFSLGKPLKISE